MSGEKKKGLSIEARVGLLVLVALGLLGAFVFVLGDVTLAEQYTIYVDYENPGNVQPGAPVNIGSIRIGKVDQIEYRGQRLDPETGRRPMIRMMLQIDEEVRDTIHEDALFYVASQSVLGESIIAVDPGTPERAALEDGAIVEGVDPPRLELALGMMYELLEGMTRLIRDNREELQTLLAATANIIRRLDGLLEGESPRIQRILEDVETAMEQSNELLSTANRSMSRLPRVVRNLDSTLAVVAENIDPLMQDTRELAAEADEALDVLGPEQRASIQRLIAGADQTVRSAQVIVNQIRSGEGSVGAFIMDEELYDDVQELVRDLKHNPWKLFWRE